MATIFGFIGFILFFLHDFNTVKWQIHCGKWLFPVGNGFVAIATIMMVSSQLRYVNTHPVQLLMGIALTIGFGILLIYTLFFALPFELTYVEQADRIPVVNTGVYALCRHPGVLWFFGAYSSLALVFPTLSMLFFSLALTTLNLLYIIYQDLFVFPQTISDYAIYKSKTPFLMPTPASITACFSINKDKEST